jgi:competence protein ComEA
MRRAIWNGLAACVAIVALAASPAALAAKKKTPTPAADASDTKSDKKADKVNLNTADEKEIAGAKGVGAKLAKELVKNRPYKTWEDVSNVKGVGSGKKLDALKKVLKLTEGVAASDDKGAKDDKKDKKTKIPSKGDEAPAAVAGGAAAGASSKGSAASESSSSKKPPSSSSESKLAPGTKININTATAEELDKLPEIGPVKAQAIVEYRKANGPFKSPEDIEKVKGIKEGTFAKIKDYVVVK